MQGKPHSSGGSPWQGDGDHHWRILSGDSTIQARLYGPSSLQEQVIQANREARHNDLRAVDAAIHLLNKLQR